MLFKQVRFEMTFEGRQGRAKLNIDGYAFSPNFRCEITKRPLDKLNGNRRVLQKVLIS